MKTTASLETHFPGCQSTFRSTWGGGSDSKVFSSPLSFHLPLSFPGGSDTQGLESDPKAGTFPGYTLVEPIEREFWALLKRGNSGLCSSAGNLGVAQECGNPGFCAADPCNSNELQGCAAHPCNSNESQGVRGAPLQSQ